MVAEFSGPPYQLHVTQLVSTTLPCLVLAGAQIHPALRTIAATLARTLPDARFVELTGSGQVRCAERRAEFADAVTAFVTEVAGGRTTFTAGRQLGQPSRCPAKTLVR